LSLIRTYTTRSHRWPSPSDSPRLESFPPRCAGLQPPTIPPGPRGPRSGEFVMASPSTLADLIRQSGFLRSISQQSWLYARSSTFKDPPVWIPDLPSFRCLPLQNCRLQLPPGGPIRALPHPSASALAIDKREESLGTSDTPLESASCGDPISAFSPFTFDTA